MAEFNQHGRYAIRHWPLDHAGQVAEAWQELEGRAGCHFFLSWLWISTWLEAYAPRVEVLEARADGEVVALGLLVRSRETRHHNLMHSRVLRLHQTGVNAMDDIWIEYNGLLTDPAHHKSVLDSCREYLVQRYSDWDELIVGASTWEDLSLCRSPALHTQKLWESSTYGVDLAALRSAGTDYLGSLSRNTRAQIRRARRRYEEHGPVRLEFAADADQARAMFAEAGPLHLARWGGPATGRGFANPHFVEFHRRLIDKGVPRGRVELSRLTSDGGAIGYLYNLVSGDRVYFYLSGLRYQSDPVLKPGLLIHALCIQHHLDAGRSYYDFMGGVARYKESLSNHQGHLYVLSLQKPLWKLSLERWARDLKRSYLDKQVT